MCPESLTCDKMNVEKLKFPDGAWERRRLDPEKTYQAYFSWAYIIALT